MKTLRLPLALAGLLLAPASALADDISGPWKVETTVTGRPWVLNCNFVQKEKDLGGTCIAVEGGETPRPLKGVVDGLNARWSYDVEVNGRPVLLAFNGNVEGTTITGTVEVSGVPGKFAALKQ